MLFRSHARSDEADRDSVLRSHISIHAPHARSDVGVSTGGKGINVFQSTLLMRGATSTRQPTRGSSRYFNPRSSCEERPLCYVGGTIRWNFNPRSSCEERRAGCRLLFPSAYFNPRSSCEERQAKSIIKFSASECISIHAPHARSDMPVRIPQQAAKSNFNPRSSCEERLPPKAGVVVSI